MKSPYEILKVPMITEKSMILNQKENKVSFVVARDANKNEIANAVEEIFNRHVIKVNTTQVVGKRKRLGMYQGRRSHWKKAICTLAKGEKIDIVEGI